MGKYAESQAKALTRPEGQVVNEMGVKVGDIFTESWGYDQTNIDAVVVVRVTKKMVAIMECRLTTIEEEDSIRVVPQAGSPPIPFTTHPLSRYHRYGKVNDAGEIMKRPLAWSDGDRDPYLSMTSYSIATLWDGERSYFDTIAAGYPGH